MTEASLVLKVDSSQAATAEKNLKGLADASGHAETKTESLTDAALKLGAAYLSFNTVSAGFRQFLNTVVETEKLRGALTTMTGSAENAGIAFDNLTKFAAKTPFTLDQSVNAFIKLKALGLDPSERALMSYGNTASAMGKDMTQMIEAVADASSFQFERLRDFGITAKQESDKVSFTFQGVTTTVGKNADEIQQYLLKIGETKFGTAMLNQMKALPGMLSNLEDSVSGLWRTIGDQGGTKALESGVSAATNAVTFLADNISALQTTVGVAAIAMGGKFVSALAATAAGFVTQTLAAQASAAAEVERATATAAAAAADLVAAERAAALSVAMGAGAVSSEALTAAQVAHTQATAALAVAQKGVEASSISSALGLGKLISILGVLTGPVGLVTMAAAGLYALVQSQKAAAEEAEKHALSLSKMRYELKVLSDQELSDTIRKQEEEIEKTKEQIRQKEAVRKAVETNKWAYDKASESIRQLNLTLDAQVDNLRHTHAMQEISKKKAEEQATATEKATAATAQSNAKTKEQEEKTRTAAQALGEFNAKMAEKEFALSHTEVELVAYRTEMELLGKNVLPEAARQAGIVAAQIYSQEAAAKAASETEKAAAAESQRLAKEVSETKQREADAAALAISKAADSEAAAQKAAAEKSAADWRTFRDSLSDSLADIILDSESAGEAIVNSFKRTFAKILAELAISGVTSMFTGSGFSVGNVLAGAGTSGSLISAGLTKFAPSLASSLGIGAAATTSAATASGAAGYMAAMEAGGAVLPAASGAAAGGAAAGGGIMSTISSAAPWVLGALAAYEIGKALDKGGTPTRNAGMLFHDVPGASADMKFNVPAFDSGFAPVGIKIGTSASDASGVIDSFRAYDSALTRIAKSAGITPNYNYGVFNSIGLGIEGEGSGVFMGLAAEDGRSGKALSAQHDDFVAAWLRGLSAYGVPMDGIEKAISAGSADAMVAEAARLAGYKLDGSHASGLDYVPWNGYKAELHQGERVQTASAARDSDTIASEVRSLRSDFGNMLITLQTIAVAANKTARALDEAVRNGDGSLSVVVA